MTNNTPKSIARPLTNALYATTAMWICAYISLLFGGQLVGEVLFVLSGLFIFSAGRNAATLSEGAFMGFLSAVFNLLLIGSIVQGQTTSEVVLEWLLWVFGLFAVSISLGALGASQRKKHLGDVVSWQFLFFVTVSGIVFLMLVTGGLVTGLEAGLAVPDWPNSYGHNMLLYPLTEMVSPERKGVFFEHAHRLTGMYVGLTSLIMVVCTWRWTKQTTIRALATLIFIFVCVQGLFGGLRVTGFLTLSQDPEVLAPNIWIGVLHGVFGQCIFAMTLCLAAMWSKTWKQPVRILQKIDVNLSFFLCLTMMIQLILGAMYRHMMGDESLAPKATHVLYSHIGFSVIVLAFAMTVGLRLISHDLPLLKKLGGTILIVVILQLFLGGGALIALIVNKGESTIPTYEILATTAHQANGALLLGMSALAYIWSLRLRVAVQ